MPLQAIRGMNDLLPDELDIWQHVEATARHIFASFNYREIRTPLLEPVNLFARSLGEHADVVEKEMYAFEDRQGKKIALRPEGTASVVRAYIQNHIDQAEPLARLYYSGPMYRYERPQKGRYRQFYQIGAEVFGSNHPLVDAELIAMADRLFKALGLMDLKLEINSLGTPLCRPKYVEALKTYLEERYDDLCEDCRRRLNTNPLRCLDSKKEECLRVMEEAPSIQDFLDEESEDHFDAVLAGLGKFGVSYAVNPRIVRGLDYYQLTTFEFTSDRLGAQNAVVGGGRYDGLVRLLGGPHVSAAGFAIGIERLVSLLAEKTHAVPRRRPLVYLATMGKAAIDVGVKLGDALREAGIRTETNYEEKGLKALLKRSNRIGADFTLIIGSDEIERQQVILRNMNTKVQEELPLDAPEEVIRQVDSQKGGVQ